MKILWTVNLIPTELADELKIKTVVLGGWVESMASKLRTRDDIKLAISCKTEPQNVFDVTVNNTRYFSIGYNARTSFEDLQKKCETMIEVFEPDLIQIEGTEFLHAKAMLMAGKKKGVPTVVSMQGILNGQYQYQCGQLQIDDMMFSRSLTNIFAAWILHLRKTRWYKPRMKPEQEIIEQADYILGRTTWDHAHTYKFNPHAKYYACNRNLREPFYQASWDIEKIERHSIYIGNGYYALKGLHYVVQALPELIRDYPDVKVYVAGNEPFKADDKRAFFKKGYGAYLQKLIRDLQVEEHIVFTGPLKAAQVAKKLAHVHTYVLCSVAENSPNTLGEAMLIGTPCVASYVGGVPDMATDGHEALFYRNDDPALLAWNIKRIFDDDKLALRLSENGHNRAAVTHDPDRNAEQLYSVYRDILRESEKENDGSYSAGIHSGSGL